MSISGNDRIVVDLAKELIKISSETSNYWAGDQKTITDFLESKMKDIGLKVEKYNFLPGKPNVIGRLNGKSERPVLMLNGHIDTVPVGDKEKWMSNPFDPVEKDGKLYGRGAADMKGALAAMICATQKMIDEDLDLKGGLIITCVADEEITGYGTKDIVDRRYISDYAIVGEPTELKVQIAHKGAVEFEIVTRGKPAHASIPRQGVNAIYKMSTICSALEEYLTELEKNKHPLVGQPSICVGKIEGGTNRNIVPESCKIEVDRRTLPGEKPDDVMDGINRILTKLQNVDPELKFDLKILNECQASETPSDSKIVHKAIEAVSEVTGENPGVTGFRAVCDMRYLVNQGKIPTIILGPGSLEQAHVIDEYVETQQLIDAMKIYHLIAKKLLS